MMEHTNFLNDLFYSYIYIGQFQVMYKATSFPGFSVLWRKILAAAGHVTCQKPIAFEGERNAQNYMFPLKNLQQGAEYDV